MHDGVKELIRWRNALIATRENGGRHPGTNFKEDHYLTMIQGAFKAHGSKQMMPLEWFTSAGLAAKAAAQ